jgi:hypothetical protein
VNLKEVPQTLESFKQLISNYDFYDLIQDGFFNIRKEFPSSPGLSVCPTCVCPTCGSKYKDSVKKASYDRRLREYSEEQSRLETLFKQALFFYASVEDNPKAEKVFSIAWEKGHSSGFSEVYNEFTDIVDLIKG